MTARKRCALSTAIITLLVTTIAATSSKADPVATIVACAGRDIAAYKWDIVALYEIPANYDPDRTKHTLLEGSCSYLVKRDNAWYAFINATNATKFANDPDSYSIPFGLFCAMGVAGYEPKNIPPHLTLAPKVFDFYNGKPYFQTDVGKADLWLRDPLGNIARATTHMKNGDYTVRFSDTYKPDHPED